MFKTFWRSFCLWYCYSRVRTYQCQRGEAEVQERRWLNQLAAAKEKFRETVNAAGGDSWP